MVHPDASLSPLYPSSNAWVSPATFLHAELLSSCLCRGEVCGASGQGTLVGGLVASRLLKDAALHILCLPRDHALVHAHLQPARQQSMPCLGESYLPALPPATSLHGSRTSLPSFAASPMVQVCSDVDVIV